MNNVLLRIKELRDTFTPSEKTIADYIVNNIKEACDMTIRDLAVKTNSSPSSLVRFCRKLGFDGYQDFNKCLLYNAASIAQEKLTIVDKAINLDDSPKSIIQKITAYNIQSLEETINFIDVDTISFCADLIKKAKKILIFGLGFSYLTAKDLYIKLLRLNLPVVSNEDYHSQLISATSSTNEDIAFIFSYSGKTKEMLNIIKKLKNNGTITIAVTRFAPSAISKLADYNLYVASVNPHFDKEAISSRLAALNIIDVLYTIYMINNYNDSLNKIANTYIEKES